MALDSTDIGSEVGGFRDVDPEGSIVTGRRLLGEAVARRYVTPRGRLIDDPNYGEDLTEHLNDDMSLGDIAAMQAAAEQEALKEVAVLKASASATLKADGGLDLVVTLTDAQGPFLLVLAVSDLGVSLLTVGT